MIIFEGYQIKPDRSTPNVYGIATDGKGGKIPNILGGLFTSPTLAKQAISQYVETKSKKE